MRDVRIGRWTVSVAAAALIFLLVASAVIGAFLVGRDDIRAGDMKDKWVFLNQDSFGNEREFSPGAYIDSRGTIICNDWRGFTAIDSNGTLLWRSTTNACPSITEGPDGGYYYVDWNTSAASSASSSNITALYSSGDFRWDYVAPKGELDLWAIYPDGQVIAHNYDWQNNEVDRIIAISNEGTELWSKDSPFLTPSWGDPRISENGTFEVIVLGSDGNYIEGISKDGTQVYLEKGEYMSPHYMETGRDLSGETYYEVRKEFIDNDTSVINVYAISLLDGSVEWKTLLHYSDNPDHTMPGVYSLSGTLVDAEGRIFCGDLEDKYSYSLNSSGAILWKKHDLGKLIDTFPSGGLLACDDSSIKRVNPDGSVASRHYAKLDGNSFILLGSDETVYYSFEAEVHALVQSSGLSMSAAVLVVLVIGDVAAVILYGLAYVLKSRRTGKT